MVGHNRLVGLMAALLMVIPFGPAAVHAATTATVSTCDEAHLRAAIASAGAEGTVTFRCSGTITLAATITISQDLTIDGSGQAVTISGGNSVQVLVVNGGVRLTLNHLSIANGNAASAPFEGGGILNNGKLRVSNSTFSGNNASDYGGAIYSSGTLSVTNTNFSGNSAISEGGGILNGGTATVIGSTFSGNSASQGDGAGIANYATLQVRNSTFNENSAGVGGGGVHSGSGTTTLANTILANSPSGGNCSGMVSDGGGNVDDGTTCGFSATNHSLSNTNPQLLPLAGNGGPTQTMALAPGSPAIGTGLAATCLYTGVNDLDQRGQPRHANTRGVCDSGAYDTGGLNATVIRVTTTADEVAVDGNCSLREAIQAASTGLPVDACPAGHGPVTIVVPAGTYDLSLCALSISSSNNVTIRGAGRDATIIDGAGNSTPDCYTSPGAGIFVISAGTTAIVCHLTMRGVGSPGYGAVVNQGALTLVDTLLTGNGAATGGGIVNLSTGRLLVQQSTITGNNADAGSPAGYGGGIANLGGSLTVMDSTISGNESLARGFGGGIYTTGRMLLFASTVGGNASLGGGGIANAGSMIVQASDVSGNRALQGGGISSSGTGSLVNDTISGNSATGVPGFLLGYGGGIYVHDRGTLNINNVTVAQNTIDGEGAQGSGGGIANDGGYVHATNSIVGGNVALNGGQGPDCSGLLTSQGYILVQDAGGCTIIGATTGDLVGANPRLGPLRNNGGPTLTMALLPGSPAIDAANPAPPRSAPTTCFPTDQRGLPRPSPPDGRCDMGAYELQQAHR